MSSTAVEQIKQRLTIIDVVGAYVELHKAGKSYKGKSPFTAEKTPSFYVSPDRGMYYCFSSSQGGDMFTFIQAMEGVDFKGALKILADKAGVELVAEDPKKRDERDTQYALIEEATVFFFKNREASEIAEKYVADRGVEGKTIHTWRIGFAPDAWRSLKEHLIAKGYTEAQMLKAGLIKKTDEAKESYDVFRNRIMFPIKDSSGRVVAFSGRTLSKDAETPKYVNSPETELFVKSDILFGYDIAKQAIRQYDFSLIVEGQFDLVLAHQAGYANTVAVSGTALTLHHIELLQRLSNRVVLSLDADRAGIAAVKRAASLMLRKGMDVKVVRIKGGKDPADIIKEDPKVFKKMVGSAVHVFEFLLEVLKDAAKDERAYKLSVREEVVPLLSSMPNHIDREHFEQIVADTIGTTKDAIHYEVERLDVEPVAKVETRPLPQQQISKPVNVPGQREELLRFLFVSTEILSRGEYPELGETILRHMKDAAGEIEVNVLRSQVPEDGGKLTFQLEEQFATYKEKQLREELSDRLTEFVRFIAKKRISELRSAIERAEADFDDERVKTLLEESKHFQTQLQLRVEL